jgi:AbiTii
MQLLDEIIDLAVDDQASISVLLRKCLVLAHRLKNERLLAWTDKELNGYGKDDEIPSYRKIGARAKGHFIGSFGRAISSQPLQASVMKHEHRHFATTAMLAQP